jgi:hypothetical protein
MSDLIRSTLTLVKRIRSLPTQILLVPLLIIKLSLGSVAHSQSAAPSITIDAANITFSQTQIGTLSGVKILGVRNSGNAVLTISSIDIVGSEASQFTQTTNCSSVSAGSTCTISITFKPTAAGAKSASLSINHNAPGSPTKVTLSGTGFSDKAEVGLLPSLLEFPKTDTGTSSAEKTLTVKNEGSQKLAVSALVFSGTNSADFSGSHNCTSVDPGATCAIQVKFSPQVPGEKFALLEIRHNGSTGSTTLTTTGTAVPSSKGSVLSDLDALRYVASHSDLVQALGADPEKGRQHYQNNGIKEGRSITFDVWRYIASDTTLITSLGADALAGVKHYINTGYKEGRKPSFESFRYIASYSDLINAFGSDAEAGARHFVGSGYKEGRQPKFEVFQYMASYPELIDAYGENTELASRQYIEVGYREARKITFDGYRYVASHPDLVAAFGDDPEKAARHYVTAGRREGRKITFDIWRYIASYSDLISRFNSDLVGAARHYITTGFKEGRGVPFECLTYIASHSDLIQAFGTNCEAGAKHYAETGSREGRSTTFDPQSYLDANPDLRSTYNGDPASLITHYIQYGFYQNRPTKVAGQPFLSVSPRRISFGTQSVNTTGTASTIIVANIGQAPLRITSISITGTDSTQFIQSNACSTVAVNATCTISTSFRPTSSGNKSATISIKHNSSSGTSSIDLDGIGSGSTTTTAPAISITPSSLSFGSQAVNTTSASQTFTVTNTGTAPLTVTSITSTDTTQFPGTQTCTTAAISPNATCSISISFKPTTAGQKTATITVNHNATGGSTTASVSGTGATESAPAITLTPSSLSFGSQTVNTTSSSQTITVKNTGTAPLAVSSVTTTTDFPATQTCTASSIAPSGSCTVNVTFKPSSAGQKTASIVINHNAGGGSTSAALSGTGVTADPSAKTTLTFTTRYQRPGPAATSGAAPGWDNPQTEPIPYVWVELRNSSEQVVASGYADSAGQIVFRDVSRSETYSLRMLAKARTSGDFDLWVVDNTNPISTSASTPRTRYAPHELRSSSFTPDSTTSAQALTFTALLGWDATSQTWRDSGRQSGPFAIIADAINQQDAASSVGAVNNINKLTILWSTKNKGGLDEGADDNFDLGTVSGSGAFAQSCSANILSSGVQSGCAPTSVENIPYIFLSGSQDFEPMEFTSQIIVHEMTHFTQKQSQRSYSPGGSHGDDEYQDLTLSHHEGFATGAATLIARSPKLERWSPSSSRIRVNIDDVSKTVSYSPIGWFQERTFTTFIWKLFDPSGSIQLTPREIYAPYYSDAWKNTLFPPSMWAYGKILKDLQPQKSGAIDLLGSQLNITLAGNDLWGSNEKTLGTRTSKQTLPVIETVPLLGSIQICSAGSPYEYNKMSNRRYFRVLGDGKVKTYKVSGPADTVPYIFIFTTKDHSRGYELFTKGQNSISESAVIGSDGAWGYITDCKVGRYRSKEAEDGACSSTNYTPPSEQCWTITVE